jgi:hypothetical protein
MPTFGSYTNIPAFGSYANIPTFGSYTNIPTRMFDGGLYKLMGHG